MSQLAVARFIIASTTNPALLSRIKDEAEGKSPHAASDAIAKLGAAEGFEFSGEEFLALRTLASAEVTASPGDGDDSILEGVSGGCGSSISSIQAVPQGGSFYEGPSTSSISSPYAVSSMSSIISALSAEMNGGSGIANLETQINETQTNTQIAEQLWQQQQVMHSAAEMQNTAAGMQNAVNQAMQNIFARMAAMFP